MKSIYFGYEEQLQKQNTLLEQEPHHPKNKEYILRFQTYLKANGRKDARVSKLMWGLRKISLKLNKPFGDATEEDIELLLSEILNYKQKNGKKLSENSIKDYKRCIKQFYIWLSDKKEYSTNPTFLETFRYIKKIKTPDPKQKHETQDLLTDDDIELLLNKGCTSEFERAILYVLFETGCRIGELLTLRIKDIQEDNDVWILNVTGKTGSRPIPIIYSIPHLVRWLELHPKKNDKESPLWVSSHNGWWGEPLRYIGARKLINRCFKQAGITKRNNPHWWRHSRCTIDAKDPTYTDTVLCSKHGHSPQVAKGYRHITANDVINSARRSAGLVQKEDVKSKLLLPQQCKKCMEINIHNAKYCMKCGKSLQIGETMEREYNELAIQMLTKIMQDPNLLKELQEYMQKT